MMLQAFCKMVPDALLMYLHLPRDLGPLLAVDRFSNFLFLNWPHAAHADYALTVDLRAAKQYEDYSSLQQRCLLKLLQRAAVVKIDYTWAALAWEWRANFNFHLCTSFRGPLEGCPRRGRCRVRGMWHFTQTPISSPLHLRLTMKGCLSRICFVLTEYHLATHEGEIVEAVLGARRPKRYLLELTILLGCGGAHLAEAFFQGRIVRQWYFMDAPVEEEQEQRVTVRFDRTTCAVHMNDVQVLHYDAEWAVALGHTWDDARLPAKPFFGSICFTLARRRSEPYSTPHRG